MMPREKMIRSISKVHQYVQNTNRISSNSLWWTTYNVVARNVASNCFQSSNFCNNNLRINPECDISSDVFSRKLVSTTSTYCQSSGFAVQTDGRSTVQVTNSLTCAPGKRLAYATKEPLLLMEKGWATWYACGPTVYDSAHIGHASSYVRYDIIRRILTGFFNTHVVMAMGITDIDDKIIKRAQEMEVDFRHLASQYEEEFYSDMQQLNVLPATVCTRVTDHIPHVVTFIDKIIKNGYAYSTSNGSVYFDVDAYGLDRYNRLASQNLDVEDDDRGEVIDQEKRHPRDFALWKGAKAGEPWWEAPWGKGRPGWHIECSAMSSAIFGTRLDIHTGGRDLAFPHHNNEIAQCQACFLSDRWANYFLHSGHLYLKQDINKMSKSLQNVVSIQEFLESFTPNQFRIFCLMSKYNHDIEYGPDIMQQAVTLLKQITSFLNDADAYVRGQLLCQPFNEADFMERLCDTQHQVVEALADDFDTKRALDSIMGVVHAGNAQLSQPSDDVTMSRSPAVVAAMATYISHVLTTLGLQLTTKSNIQTDQSSQLLTSTLDTLVNFRQEVRCWALTTPEVDGMSNIIQSSDVQSKDAKQQRKQLLQERVPLLQACDNVRETLANSGVQIKDRGRTATWEFVETKKSTTTQGKDEER